MTDFETVRIDHVEAMNTPSDIVYESETVRVYKTLIPYDYDNAHIIFFVTGVNGDEFGQFGDEEKAIERGAEATRYYEQLAYIN